MQKRIGTTENGKPVALKLCALVDFLGPLPSSVIDKHPMREDLFTPEGQVLRPVTPDAAGVQEVEAIEPVNGPQTKPPVSADTSGAPRPRLLAERLADAEGASDILEFLGRLLIPDPEQRPSAGEALAHHFLRFAHTKGGANADKKAVGFDGSKKEKDAHAKIEDSHGDNESKLARKGTGFVHVGELPPSDDEEEDEEHELAKKAADGKKHAQ